MKRVGTMHCPHGMVDCSTCENSAVARELRDLRRVFRAAKRLLENPASAANVAALGDIVEMAEETSGHG